MKNRKHINDNIVKWIVNKVSTEYVVDVSLVLIYGSYVNGTANSKSDVDCYYIPKTERGYDLAISFIIDGVGYDIYPIPWERIEKIADLLDNMSPLVGDAEIIYSSSPEDVERFKEEAGRLCAMLNHNRSESEIRKIAGFVIMILADAVAVYKHEYYHFGLKKQFEDLRDNIPNVPQRIVDGYRSVVEAVDIGDVIKYAMKLFEDVCAYLNVVVALPEVSGQRSQAVNKVDASSLAMLYEEISSTFNKIYVCCEAGNYILAFLSAVCLQRDLDDAKEAGCHDYDLLSGFNYKELNKLSETAREVEDDLVRMITDNGGCIRKYDSFERFEAGGMI